MKWLITIVVMFVIAGACNISGHRRGFEEGILQERARMEVASRMEELTSLAASVGPRNLADSCRDPIRIQTQVGELWLACSVAGELYDPSAHEVVDGNEFTLPIGVYTRLENGDPFFQKGWQARDVTLSVRASRSNPSKQWAEPLEEAETRL